MDVDVLILLLGGASLSVMGFFLKRALEEIKEVKDMSIDNKQKLAILEIDYLNKVAILNEKIDDLQSTIRELTGELRDFNKKIK